MLKTQKLTPSIYYDRSRDFQALGRVYDMVFNYMKTNTDLLNNAPLSDNFDTKLLNLITTTLGFKEAHAYNNEELKALCTIFSTAIRNKGNIQSINLILNMLANVYNTNSEYYAYVDEKNSAKIYVFIPDSITNITLFKDVLNYILPAGVICEIVNTEVVKNIITTNVTLNSDNISINGKKFSQVETSTVFAPIKKDSALNKYFGKLTNSTVLRVNSKNSTENKETAKLKEIKESDYQKIKTETDVGN